MSLVSEYFLLGKSSFSKKNQIALSQPVMNYLAFLLLGFSPLCLFVFFSLHLFEDQALILEGRTIIC